MASTIQEAINEVNKAKLSVATTLVENFGVQQYDILVDPDGNGEVDIETYGIMNNDGTAKSLSEWNLALLSTPEYLKKEDLEIYGKVSIGDAVSFKSITLSGTTYLQDLYLDVIQGEAGEQDTVYLYSELNGRYQIHDIEVSQYVLSEGTDIKAICLNKKWYNLPTQSSTTTTTTDGYWANVKVSDSSSIETTPLFKRIGINTGTSNSYVINAEGNMSIEGNIYTTSDIRYKDVLEDLNINSNQLAKIPLFNFQWKDLDSSNMTGTSALEVQKILPNIVSGNDKLSVDYSVLGTVAGITACKEIEELKKRILELENKLNEYGRG